MLSTVRTWWVRRQQRKGDAYVHEHEWITPSELDDAAERYEGGGSDSLIGRPMGGIGGTLVRHVGRTKLKRGD